MPETTRAEQMFGDFAPKLVSLTTDVLFADIWERAELASRDRSLITVAALVATGSTEQLPGHLARALANGLTRPSSRRSSPTSRSTPDGQKQCPQWPSRSGNSRTSRPVRPPIWPRRVPCDVPDRRTRDLLPRRDGPLVPR